MTADLLQAIVAATMTRVAARRAVVPAASLEARTVVQSAPLASETPSLRRACR